MQSMKKQTKGRLPSGYATQETRFNAVQRVFNGESPEVVIKELGFHRSRIYAWLKAHKQQELGFMRNHTENRSTGSFMEKQTENKSANTAPALLPLSCDHMEEWILLLHQSLLDSHYPLSAFLERLALAVGGHVVIATDLHNPAGLIRPINKNLQLDATIDLNKVVADNWYTNPFLQVLTHSGIIKLLDELLPRNEWPGNGFCRLMVETGSKNALAMSFSGPNQTLCGLFMYQWTEYDFDQQTQQFLCRLRPHLETAMALAVNHWRNSFTVKALEEATDHMKIAALVLDGKREVIKYSGTAKEILEQKRYLKQCNQQLDFCDPEYQQQFEQAVNQAIAWRQTPIGNKPVIAMRFSYPLAGSGVNDRKPLTNHEEPSGKNAASIGVLVQAITPPSTLIPHSVAVLPHVIVYIGDPDKLRPSPEQQIIKRLFSLSTREARLTALLTDGQSLAEAAKIMDITQTTARTYLQHVYDKVGVKRQQDLVQRVMKSVAVLAS